MSLAWPPCDLLHLPAARSDLKAQLDGGADFAALATEHSTCPSGKRGGSLGSFGPGQMVKEFDAVVFGPLEIGTVSEVVKTQFGSHLILVTERSGGD